VYITVPRFACFFSEVVCFMVCTHSFNVYINREEVEKKQA
jgi:hypothetical protein